MPSPNSKVHHILASSLSGKRYEAGCDEAGRGCLAGPVFAAAVIFDRSYKNPAIQDSKLLNEADREALCACIKKDALAYGIASCSPLEIDKWNILQSSIKAMHRALKKLSIEPEHVLVDGNYFLPYKQIPYQTVVKGDSKYLSIAAASILAKVSRDLYMKKIAKTHPEYQWITNKGYPTASHRKAIASCGITKYHRMSFQLLKGVDNNQLSLDF